MPGREISPPILTPRNQTWLVRTGQVSHNAFYLSQGQQRFRCLFREGGLLVLHVCLLPQREITELIKYIWMNICTVWIWKYEEGGGVISPAPCDTHQSETAAGRGQSVSVIDKKRSFVWCYCVNSEYSSLDYPSLITTLLHVHCFHTKAAMRGKKCWTFQSHGILLITIMQSNIMCFAFSQTYCAALWQMEGIMSVIIHSRWIHKVGEREAGGCCQTAAKILARYLSCQPVRGGGVTCGLISAWVRTGLETVGFGE